MLRAFMAVYPWDLADEGLEGVLDRLRGEVGLTGLSLWVGAPAGTRGLHASADPRRRHDRFGRDAGRRLAQRAAHRHGGDARGGAGRAGAAA